MAELVPKFFEDLWMYLTLPRSDRVTPGPLLPPGLEVSDDSLAETVVVESRAQGTPGNRPALRLGGPVVISPPEIRSKQLWVLAHFQKVFRRL